MASSLSQYKKYTNSEYTKFITGKRDLYYATIRYGNYLPSFKSSIITEDYINGVIEGRIYCPTYDDIKLKPCPFPPSKEALLDYAKKIKTPSNKPLCIWDEN